MTRIRYVKNKEANTLTSVKPILCGSIFTRLSIDLNTMSWFIINAENNIVLSTGKNNTIAKIKKDIKNETLKLGATYFNEVRNRKLILTNSPDGTALNA
jgi:hypothetical protein